MVRQIGSRSRHDRGATCFRSRLAAGARGRGGTRCSAPRRRVAAGGGSAVLTFGKVRGIPVMSLQSLNKAADECFQASMPQVRTLEEHEAAIEVWNQLLDDAIANAIRARDRYVEEHRYEHAAIA